MEKTNDNRTAQRVSTFRDWMEAKSDIGSFLMGEDGPVSRKEVLLVNIIIILLVIGAFAADGALWLTALCVVCAVVFVRQLNREKEDNSKQM